MGGLDSICDLGKLSCSLSTRQQQQRQKRHRNYLFDDGSLSLAPSLANKDLMFTSNSAHICAMSGMQSKLTMERAWSEVYDLHERLGYPGGTRFCRSGYDRVEFCSGTMGQ